MNLKPVADRLSLLGLGVQGQTLFINHFPAIESAGLLLRPPLVGAKLDHDLPGFIKFEFKLIARAKGHVAAETLARDAVDALWIKQETQVGPWFVKYMRPMHVPVAYPISIGELVECNTDIAVCAVIDEWV